LKSSLRSTQAGFSLLGSLALLLVILAMASFGLKLGPHYLQFRTLRSTMDDLSTEPGVTRLSRQALIQLLEKKLYINDIRTLKPESFSWEKTSSGPVLSVHYEVREHLFGNLDAVLTFDHQTQIPGS